MADGPRWKTDAEVERDKRIWHEAHGIAAETMPLIRSGICQQPGLAASLANFAVATAQSIIPQDIYKDAAVLGAGFAMVMPDGTVLRLRPEDVTLGKLPSHPSPAG